MSKFHNQISSTLCAISIGISLVIGAPDAIAQFVTALDQAPAQVRICPDKKCLQIFEHPFKRGKKIVIYEKKNGWVRLSRIISPEQLEAKFPNQKLPANAALWIPAGDLPLAIASQFHSDETKPETGKKPKLTVYKNLPKTVPQPATRPARQVAVSTQMKTAKTEPTAKSEIATKQQTPNLPEVKKNETTSADKDKNAEVKLAAVEPKTKPEVETDSFGNPIVKLPSKLTKKLKDKRLAKLPRKPKNGLDLKSVIAIRYHGLRLLNDGSCKAIREGNRSLSLAGWIYVMCEDDGQYRQFPVE